MRVELSALHMTATPTPAMLITGGDSPTPAIDTVRFALSQLPGEGHFACCACEHMRITDDGVSMPIPCEKLMAGRTMIDLLERRVDHHRCRGEWDEMRLWNGFSPRFLCGLGVEEAMTSTPRAFLRAFEFTNDEPAFSQVAAGRQSTRGVSPLFLAVLSGNGEVTRALARTNPADVTARLKSDFPALGLWVGCEPIHAAAAFCVTNHVPLIATLLEAGADPNTAAGKVGLTPLYVAAALAHNLEGVQALISAAGDRLKIEKENRVISETALGGCAYYSTPVIVSVLLAANAQAAHVISTGLFKTDARVREPLCHARHARQPLSRCRDRHLPSPAAEDVLLDARPETVRNSSLAAIVDV